VYRARQKSLDRVVALKLLPCEISVDRACVKWFIQESRTLARLSHPNIVAVYDSGETAEGHLYFVMELVEGEDLSKLIHGAGIFATRAIEIILSVCGA
jgi:serine/threonine protein kinase